MTMTLELPDQLHLDPDQVRVELAVALFQQERLSFGQARRLAGLSVWGFHQALGARHISLHYDVEELAADVATSKAIGQW